MKKVYVATDSNGEVLKEFNIMDEFFKWWYDSEYNCVELWVVNKYQYKWYGSRIDTLIKD